LAFLNNLLGSNTVLTFEGQCLNCYRTMRNEKFPVTITEKGVSAVIRQALKIKGGKKLEYFIVEYILLGKRKQVWRSDLDKAKAVAREACIKIANGDQSALELRNGELLAYTRAVEILSPTRVPIDTACREFTDAMQILGGHASIIEACRDWMKRNAVSFPKITVADAVAKVQSRSIADNKSKGRQHELEVLLNRFAESFQCEAHTVTPSLISAYLTALPLSERSKRNHQDAIKHLNRWLVFQGYLAKGTDWMEGVQKYSKRKHGEVTIYAPEEMAKIMKAAKGWQIPVCAILGFSTMRHSEIQRLDWAQVELSDNPGESFIEVLPIEGTKSDQRRRLVPISDNLKAWLKPHAKNSGPVCLPKTEKILPQIVSSAGVKFNRNAFRHSAISYRVAQTGDIARVSDESGNSVQVIRSNYLRRVKPAVAAEWFSIMPPRPAIIRKLVLN